MTKLTKRTLLSIGAILVIFVFAIVGIVWSVLNSFDFKDKYLHRLDAEMIQNFRDHRSEFERIRSMLERDDRVFRIVDDWTDPVDIPPEKVIEYRRLFTVIGIPSGFYYRRNPLRIELVSSTQGWVASGSMKGYLFTDQKPPGTIVDSLDDHEKLVLLDVDYLIPLEGNWYLYFRRS